MAMKTARLMTTIASTSVPTADSAPPNAPTIKSAMSCQQAGNERTRRTRRRRPGCPGVEPGLDVGEQRRWVRDQVGQRGGELGERLSEDVTIQTISAADQDDRHDHRDDRERSRQAGQPPLQPVGDR